MEKGTGVFYKSHTSPSIQKDSLVSQRDILITHFSWLQQNPQTNQRKCKVITASV